LRSVYNVGWFRHRQRTVIEVLRQAIALGVYNPPCVAVVGHIGEKRVAWNVCSLVDLDVLALLDRVVEYARVRGEWIVVHGPVVHERVAELVEVRASRSVRVDVPASEETVELCRSRTETLAVSVYVVTSILHDWCVGLASCAIYRLSSNSDLCQHV